MTTSLPILRLGIGRWPNRAEWRCSRAAFCRAGDTVPPLLRSLASLPAGRAQMAGALTMHGDDPGLAEQLARAMPSSSGAVWLGPKLSMLHFEKTGGHSLLAWLRGHIHPQQIDTDPSRAIAADQLSAFLPAQAAEFDRYSLVWGHYDLPALRRLGPHRMVMTLLRDPEARLISLYRYWRSVVPEQLGPVWENIGPRLAHRLSLDDFLRCDEPLLLSATDNLYVRRLIGRYPGPGDPALGADDLADALTALDGLDCVGVTEDLPRSLAAFSTQLGLPAPLTVGRLNQTDSNHRHNPLHRPAPPTPLTPATREALRARTSLDRQVYAAAVSKVENAFFS